MKRRTAGKDRKRPGPLVGVDLTTEDLAILVRVVDYYQKSMGPMRHLVRLTGSGETKRRFRFLEEESLWLRRFAEAAYASARDKDREASRVSFTPLAAVAFWGRLLASLQSHRSRRRLPGPEIEKREALSVRLCASLRRLGREHPDVLAAQLATRRPAEQDWMRAALAACDE